MNEPLIKRVDLGNDLVLEFHGRSNRYFGDYHRVQVDIDLFITTPEGILRLRHQRPLKKMGVSGADIRRETEFMVSQFLSNTALYMRRPGFNLKLLESMQRPGQRLWKHID